MKWIVFLLLPRFDSSSKIEDWKDSINFLTVRINPFTPRGLPQTPRNMLRSKTGEKSCGTHHVQTKPRPISSAGKCPLDPIKSVFP